MKKSTLDTIEKLKPNDLVALNYLYLYRAMDIEQLMKEIYEVDTETAGGKRSRTVIIKRLMSTSVVTTSKYLPNREALQITNKGIDIVRYTRDIPNEVFDANTKTIERGYYTAADLNLGSRFINHQVHLNQFMLDFQEYAKKLGIPWHYYDEKFLSQYVGMRPDGMITMLDHDFFIEIDMATESKDQLKEKWEHYRSFMKTDEYKHKSRKIVVLFDVDNLLSKNKIANRVNLVKSTLVDGILDEINNDFEIVIKPRAELIKYMFESLVPDLLRKNEKKNSILNYFEEKKYSLAYGFGLNKTLHGDFYNYYLRNLDKKGKIIINDGVVDEFFADFYLDEEMSVLHRVNWYEKNSYLYKESFGRPIRLIVVTDDLETLFEDFKLVGMRILGQPGIFILDTNRLDTYNPIYMNLLQFGLGGEVFKITTPDLSRREFIYKINSNKSINHRKGNIKHNGKRKV